MGQVSKYTYQCAHCWKYYSETLLFLTLSRIYYFACVVCEQMEVFQFACVELIDLRMTRLPWIITGLLKSIQKHFKRDYSCHTVSFMINAFEKKCKFPFKLLIWDCYQTAILSTPLARKDLRFPIIIPVDSLSLSIKRIETFLGSKE